MAGVTDQRLDEALPVFTFAARHEIPLAKKTIMAA